MATAVAPAVDNRALTFIEGLALPSGLTFGQAFERDPWLRDAVLTPVMALNAEGFPLHRHAWIELHRGAGKTTLAGAISFTEALRGPETEIICIAADADQARLLLGACDGFIRRSPRLAAAIRRTQNEFRVKSNGSRIKVMSSDAPSFYGIGVGCARLRIVADELSQWARPDLWWAALSTLPKLADAQLLAITNAGVGGTWQADARETVAANGYLYAPQGIVASWITEADVAAARAVLPELLFRRYYGNEWVAETGQAIEAADWDACAGAIPPLDASTPVIVGLDAAISGDSFAAIAVSRALPAPTDLPEHHRSETDGQRAYRRVDYSYGISLLEPPEGDTGPPHVWVRAVKIWRPERGNIDFGVPYAWLSDFAAANNIAAVCYDPWQLHDFCTRWRQEHGIYCKPFDQGPRRSQADTDLLQLIRARRFRHDGDPQLREHALNAAIKITPREDTRGRLVKAHPSKKVDGLIATSMAAAECLRLNV